MEIKNRTWEACVFPVVIYSINAISLWLEPNNLLTVSNQAGGAMAWIVIGIFFFLFRTKDEREVEEKAVQIGDYDPEFPFSCTSCRSIVFRQLKARKDLFECCGCGSIYKSRERK